MTREEYIDTNEYGYDADKGIWSNYWEKFLEGYIRKDGYVRVFLKCNDGKRRCFLYHRALWYLVYGPIPEGMEINHLDENKQNNRLSNLSLTSHVENCNWKSRNERIAAKRRGSLNYMFGKHHSKETKEKIAAKKRGVQNPRIVEQNKRLFSKAVVDVDKNNNVVYEFASVREAERQGFNHGSVSECCRNCYMREGNNIYKGYRWYYKEEWEKLVWEKEQKRLHFKLT